MFACINITMFKNENSAFKKREREKREEVKPYDFKRTTRKTRKRVVLATTSLPAISDSSARRIYFSAARDDKHRGSLAAVLGIKFNIYTVLSIARGGAHCVCVFCFFFGFFNTDFYISANVRSASLEVTH